MVTILPPEDLSETTRRRRSLPSLPRPTLPGGVGTSRPSLVTVLAVLATLLALISTVGLVAVKHSLDDLRATVAADDQARQRLSDQLASATRDTRSLGAGFRKAAAASIDTGAVSARVVKSVFTIDAGPSLGSAFAVRRTGLGGTTLVTNYHVVRELWQRGGRQVTLRHKGRAYTGRVHEVRAEDDLATVRVLAKLPLLRLAKTRPETGDPVLAVGSPLGIGVTVTSGVVSAERRRGMIQISAPISPGNSGGPVVDASGQVIGVATQKIVVSGSEGLGFAIPVSDLCSGLLSC